MAAPLCAGVGDILTITGTPSGNDLTISYAMSADPNDTPVAFGLNVAITAGCGCITGSSSYSANFEVYPDYIYDLIQDSRSYVWGSTDPNNTPIADPAAAGGLDLGPAVTSASICMARIQETTPGPNPGPTSDTLVTLTLEGVAAVSVTIDADSTRGGVVSSGPVSDNLPQIVAMSLVADCWACDGQNLGNTNGDTAINYVDLGDWSNAIFTNCTSNTWGAGLNEYNACADTNHDGAVNYVDLGDWSNGIFTSGYTACTTTARPCE
jgi:hypothetical protein